MQVVLARETGPGSREWRAAVSCVKKALGGLLLSRAHLSERCLWGQQLTASQRVRIQLLGLIRSFPRLREITGNNGPCPHLITPKIPSRAVVGTEQQVSGNLSGVECGDGGGEPS